MTCENKCISPRECGGLDQCLDRIRPVSDQPLIYRLRKRAEIRRQNMDRVSVQEGQPDRISELLEEAASRLDYLLVDNK